MSGKKAETRKNPIFLGKKYKDNVKKSRCILSAVENDNVRAVKEFLDQGCSVEEEYEDREFDTLLHIASRNGHGRVIEVLLSHGAEIDNLNEYGFSPLDVAIISGHLEAVKSLINGSYMHGKYTIIEARSLCRSGRGLTPLHLAAKFGHPEIIRFLIDCGADTDAKAYLDNDVNEATPLYVAMNYMHKDCFELLLQYSGDLSTDSKIIFAAASSVFNYDEYIRIPFNPKRKINREEQLICLEFIDKLLNAGAKFFDDTENHQNALIVAAKFNRYWVVKRLLENEYNVNSRRYNNETALHLACQYASPNVVSILLKAGADATLIDTHGDLPIHHAAYGKNWKILPTLIEAGVDINAKTLWGKTVYMCIAKDFEKNNPEHVKCFYMFLKYGLDLNAKNRGNNTALHSLSDFYTHDSRSAHAFLLERYLDLNIMDDYGETPLTSAIKNGGKVRLFIIKAIAYMECHEKFQISESNMLLISKNGIALYQKCKSELQILKNHKLYGEITFYDVLSSPLKILKQYTYNLELMQVFNSYAWKFFPAYGEIIKDRITFALESEVHVEDSINSLNKLLYPKLVPRHITNDIISFLHENDLTTLSSITI